MAIQLINIGNVANDGTGDDLREAMVKINQNFEELDLRDDEQTTAVNIGAVGEGILAQKLNYELQFKKIVPGKDITLTATDDTITVDANGGLKQLLVVSDNGSLFLEETASLNINGGNNIDTQMVGNTILFDYTGWSQLSDDTSPTLGGNLNADGFNLTNVGTISSSDITGPLTGNVTGNVTGLVHNIDIREINEYIFDDKDFGDISKNHTSILEFVLAESIIDLGTFRNPNANGLDAGFIF